MNSSALKIIAALTMLIDHLTAILYPKLYEVFWGIECQEIDNDILYSIGRMIGRIAYPLFCFMIAQGAKYSKNRVKYAMRLLALALISVPCHNFMITGDMFYGLNTFLSLGGLSSFTVEMLGTLFSDEKELNTVFGLFLGLVAVILIDYIDNQYQKQSVPDKSQTVKSITFLKSDTMKKLIKTGVVVLLCFVSIILKIEYSACSIILICAFYYSEKYDDSASGLGMNKKTYEIIFFVLAFTVGMFIYVFSYYVVVFGNEYTLDAYMNSAMLTMGNESIALLAAIPIWFYNGSKGKAVPKYFLYAFYPVHMLIIGILAMMF